MYAIINNINNDITCMYFRSSFGLPVIFSRGPIVDNKEELKYLKDTDGIFTLKGHYVIIFTKIDINIIIKNIINKMFFTLDISNHQSYRRIDVEVSDENLFNEFLKNIGFNKKIKIENDNGFIKLYDIE